MAAARDERLKVAAVNFEHVCSRRVFIDCSQQTVASRCRNEWIVTSEHKEAIRRKTAQVFRGMGARKRLGVMWEPVAFLNRPVLDDPRGEAYPNDEISAIR